MDIKTAFRSGFLKKAYEKGMSTEDAIALYKSAFNDLPISSTEAADWKDELRDQGVQPQLEGGDQDYAARWYNHKLISERDRLGAKNPDIEAIRGGLVGGGVGAGLGALGGHMAGHYAASTMDPLRFGSAMKHMPGRFRTGGMLLGALAGGIPGAVNARHRVDIAQKLQDPRNLQSMIGQVQQERHLANNQF